MNCISVLMSGASVLFLFLFLHMYNILSNFWVVVFIIISWGVVFCSSPVNFSQDIMDGLVMYFQYFTIQLISQLLFPIQTLCCVFYENQTKQSLFNVTKILYLTSIRTISNYMLYYFVLSQFYNNDKYINNNNTVKVFDP